MYIKICYYIDNSKMIRESSGKTLESNGALIYGENVRKVYVILVKLV